MTVGLFHLINRLSVIQSDRKSLYELINYSSQIALKFLNGKYHTDRQKFLNLGYSFSDIAVGAVIPLFIKNKSSNELGIIKSYHNWQNPIKTEEQAEYFLNKIVINRVNQELIQIYKEADPFFSHILDSVEFIISSEGYYKETHCGTVYIHKFKSKFQCPERLITIEKFEDLSAELFFGKIKSVIDNIFFYLQTETEFQTAIPLNALIKRIKLQSQTDYQNYGDSYSEIHEEVLDIKRQLEESLKLTIEKIETTYKTKLNDTESSAFKNTLIDICIDLSNGGIASELFYYLQKHMDGLEKNHYYKKYYSILDYLVRILKKELSDRLMFESKFSNRS